MDARVATVGVAISLGHLRRLAHNPSLLLFGDKVGFHPDARVVCRQDEGAVAGPTEALGVAAEERAMHGSGGGCYRRSGARAAKDPTQHKVTRSSV